MTKMAEDVASTRLQADALAMADAGLLAASDGPVSILNPLRLVKSR